MHSGIWVLALERCAIRVASQHSEFVQSLSDPSVMSCPPFATAPTVKVGNTQTTAYALLAVVRPLAGDEVAVAQFVTGELPKCGRSMTCKWAESWSDEGEGDSRAKKRKRTTPHLCTVRRRALSRGASRFRITSLALF